MPSLALDWMTHPPADYTGGAVSIGNFDGVHRGHAHLVRTVVEEARRVGGPAVLVTFDPPPLALLDPPAAKPPLTTPAERTAQLLQAGADRVATLKTNAGLLALGPIAFFEDVIAGLFRAKGVVEGFNFRFGRGRAGNVEQLRALCRTGGMSFREVSPIEDAGGPISSSRVRSALGAGEVSVAEALLGRPYSIAGIVETGAKRGRTIGFPTANLGGVATLIPKNGVYAVQARLDGKSYRAAANIGPNPTFGENAQKLEVHLLDFDGDLYGRVVSVEFRKRLRETRPFANVGELIEQLKRDAAAARA